MNVPRSLLLLSLTAMVITGCASPTTEIPSSFDGFVGSVQGRVISVHQDAFVMGVDTIIQLREDNKAPRPGVGINHEFAVHPRIVTDQYGRRHPVAEHQVFIDTLSPGDRITIRVRHVAGNQLRLLELTDEQKARLNL